MPKVRVSQEKKHQVTWGKKSVYAVISVVDYDFYGQVPKDIKVPEGQVFYEDGNTTEKLQELSDFQVFFIDLERLHVVNENLEHFAKLFQILLLEKGRVIVHPEFYRTLEEQYPINLGSERVRVEGGVLKFLLYHVSLEGIRSLRRVSVELSELKAHFEEISPISGGTQLSRILSMRLLFV